jgi:hypothetical protein
VSRLLRLYPGAWRDRYGEEFLALLAERPSSFADRVDIVRGALDARLQPQIPGPDRVPDRSGLATLAGFGFLVLAMILWASGPIHYDDYGSYRDGAAAHPYFLAAFGLLSFGIFRLMKRLSLGWDALPRSGVLAIIFATAWSVGPWMWLFGVAFLACLVTLAIGLRRLRLMSTLAVLAIGGVAIVPVVAFAAMLFLPWYALRESGLNFVIIMAPLSCLWLIVGVDLLRGSSRPVLEPIPSRPATERAHVDAHTG